MEDIIPAIRPGLSTLALEKGGFADTDGFLLGVTLLHELLHTHFRLKDVLAAIPSRRFCDSVRHSCI